MDVGASAPDNPNQEKSSALEENIAGMCDIVFPPTGFQLLNPRKILLVQIVYDTQ
jgi:hypothetical protein